MFRAIIFDFDGVITDTEFLHFSTFNQVLAKHGVEIKTDEYYRDYLGLTDFDCFKLLAKEGRLKADLEDIQALTDEKNILYSELVKTENKIIDGAPQFIKMLHENKIPMAIYSGALLREIELILKNAGLREFFKAIISADHVTKGKPDPQGFEMALEKLNENAKDKISPNECIVIEDARWGIEGAKKAGMHIIGVTNSYDAEELSMAEMTIEQLDNLTICQLQKLCS